MKLKRPVHKVLYRFSLLSTVLVSQVTAAQPIQRQFTTDNGSLISVTADQVDDSHASITAIEISKNGLSELRLIDPKNGQTTLWQLENATQKWIYTLPTAGKFHRLKIETREAKGTRTATYVLAPNRASYVQVESHFAPYKVMFQDISACEVSPEALLGLNQPNIDFLLTHLSDKSKAQTKSLLDRSCYAPPFLKDSAIIEKGIASVIATEDTKLSSKNRYLSCLTTNGLKYYSTQLSNYFGSQQKTVYCSPSNSLDSNEQAEYDPDKKQTIFDQPFDPARPQKLGVAHYADTFFHESLHRVGITDEQLVGNIVSCCGLNQTDSSRSSCADIKIRAQKLDEVNARLTALSKLDGFDAYWGKIAALVGSQRADNFFSDLHDAVSNKFQNKDDPSTPKNIYSACMATPSHNDQECMDHFLEALKTKLTPFYDTECPELFADKTWKESARPQAICKNLFSGIMNVLKTNAETTIPGAKGPNPLANSKLSMFNANQDELLKAATNTGQIVANPFVNQIQAQDSRQVQFRDAYLTSFSKYLPGTAGLFHSLVDAESAELAQNMFYHLILKTQYRAGHILKDRDDCMKNGLPNCEEQAEKSFLAVGKEFFDHNCPLYFNMSDLSKNTVCTEEAAKVGALFRSTFDRKCPVLDTKHYQNPSGTGLTCLIDALSEGASDLQNYDKLKKDGTLLNSNDFSFWNDSDSSKTGLAQQAGNGTNSQSYNSSAQKGGGSQKTFRDVTQPEHQIDAANQIKPVPPTDSPNSISHPTYSFNPSSNSDWDQAEKDIEDTSYFHDISSQAKNAASMISNANAATARSTSSSSTPPTYDGIRPTTPASSAQEGSSQGPRSPLPQTQMPNQPNYYAGQPATSQGYPGSNAASAMRSPATPSDNQAGSDSESDGSSQGNPAQNQTTSSNSQNGKRSKRKSGKGGAGSGDSSVSKGSSDAGGSGGGGYEPPETLVQRQARLSKHFKENNELTLSRLKSGELDAELDLARIEAKDDRGVPHGFLTEKHGGDQADIHIWYDRTSQSFKGLPATPEEQ